MLSKARLRFGLLSVGHLRKKLHNSQMSDPDMITKKNPTEHNKNETHSSYKNSGQWKVVTFVIEFSFNRNDSRLCISTAFLRRKVGILEKKASQRFRIKLVFFHLREKKKNEKSKTEQTIKMRWCSHCTWISQSAG